MRRFSFRRRSWVILPVAAGLALAACGDRETETPPGDDVVVVPPECVDDGNPETTDCR